MKTVILAGGLGTRLSEETANKPKPMVKIGPYPLLYHIMKNYIHYGCQEFIVALGYKSEVIKDYFLRFNYHNHNLTVNLKSGGVIVHGKQSKEWVVHLVDTGLTTETGGRLKQLQPWIGEETFLMTYGDGLSDLNIADLISFHKSHGKLATLTAVCSPSRYGILDLEDDFVSSFREKPVLGEGCYINGGFFVLEPTVFKYIEGEQTVWEQESLFRLALDGQLAAYRHKGFWQSVDTLKEKILLESMWNSGQAAWIIGET
jgi:glucose-1-phosphate cytidylyltransferase